MNYVGSKPGRSDIAKQPAPRYTSGR